MLADGLNNGAISRVALRLFAQTGAWEVVGEMKKFKEVARRPVQAARDMFKEAMIYYRRETRAFFFACLQHPELALP